jgi:uncharacterized phage protein gp47/JayE
MSGLTPQGFVIRTLQEIKADIEAAMRSAFGASIDVSPVSFFGQLIGVMAERLADLWQLGQATYNGAYRESATGTQLDSVGALTGTPRLPATYTKVVLVLTGAGTLPSGRVVKTASGVAYASTAPVVLPASAEFTAVVAGPTPAFAGTVNIIDTPVAGWAGATNPSDQTVVGSLIESDPAYRLRQAREVRGQGLGTVAAMRSRIAKVVGVSEVSVVDNGTDATVDTVPPHSVECIVQGGSNTDVAQAIFDSRPVGVGTAGNTLSAAADPSGFPVATRFSRPETLLARVAITVRVDPAVVPNNAATLIAQAVALRGSIVQLVGAEVRASSYMPAIFAACPGILECDVPLLSAAVAAPPVPTSAATITVNNRQRAVLDTSRISVNIVNIAP